MKKYFLCLFAFLLLISMSACKGNKPDEPALQNTEIPDNSQRNPLFDSTELLMVRQSMIETNFVAAVAYYGWFDGEYSEIKNHLDNFGIVNNLPFLAEIDEDYFVKLNGQELYCIIPRSEDAEITIYEWIVDEYNDYAGEPGNVLLNCKEGVPVLVAGNESEIVPNFMVEIIEDGVTYEYTPCLSGFDGSLYVPDDPCFISDITPYDLLGINLVSQPFDVSDLWLAQSWSATVVTADGNQIDLIFTFYDDGFMEFCYGPSEGEIEVYYEGYYMEAYDESYPENTFLFELVSDHSNLYSVFQITSYPEYNEIYLEWVDGDNFIEQDLYGQYLLTESVG